jgi:hypothetical protein
MQEIRCYILQLKLLISEKIIIQYIIITELPIKNDISIEDIEFYLIRDVILNLLHRKMLLLIII